VSAAEELISAHDGLSEEFLDEHIEHADERWLMSYADMMTLLFGLFVMLYAMYDNFGAIQQSAAMKFSSSREKGGTQEDPAVVKQIEDNALEKVKIENETLRVKVEALETAVTAEKAKAAEANAMMEIIKAKAETVVPDQSLLVKSLEEERNALRAQLAQVSAEQLGGNRNRDNRPLDEESRVELRSDGLGGKGGGGKGKKREFKVEVTLPNGRVISEQTKQVGPNGVQLESAPDVSVREKFSVRITSPEGRSVEIRSKALLGDDGKVSNRIKFVSFPNADEDSFYEMLKAPEP
jgi:flagellar motor protein MotB